MYTTIAAFADDGKCSDKDLDTIAQKRQIDRPKLDAAKAVPA